MAKRKPEPPALPSGKVPVEMKVELVSIADLILDPTNANTHPEKNLESIKGSFGMFDQYLPLGVDANNIVRVGNGRLVAMRALGYTHAYITRLDRYSPSELTALGIADNRTGQLGEFDRAVLAMHLEGLAAESIDLGRIGFDEVDLGQLGVLDLGTPGGGDDGDGFGGFGAGGGPSAPDEFQAVDETIETEFCCPKCGYEWSGKPR